ncbi:hypothetical protein [Chitinophaga silvisoli]|uniref:Uncharacterized protein n=1 Tax=Chitinophaga silvisoli TaxID=2291814 RepID=A0A3E1P2Z0_9BACT|nr:hypothetical protein [Chitinophaga silvisoli]RFM34490.1 hypothetical protein DXN04_14535 [Chitinophaga silvisoli]
MIRIRVKKPKHPVYTQGWTPKPSSLEQAIRTKEQADELVAEINYLSEMSRKGTPVSESTGYRFACGNKLIEVGPRYKAYSDFDPNNPKHVEYLKKPFVPTFSVGKPPTQEEINAKEMKEFEDYCKEVGLEWE